ncbi:MAG: hypothetical protein ABIS01_12185 [Ferruginibacter sp.]
MKKILLAAAMMIGFFGISNAQKVATSATTKPATKKVVGSKPVANVTTTIQPVKSPSAKASAVVAVKPVNPQGVVLKKDGTPDKRYSSATVKPKGPVKKDGTADMRFKTNKKS